MLELSGNLQIESRAIAIVSGPAPPSLTVSDLINETTQAPRQYLILTSSGITFVVKERPLDVMLKLIAALPSSYGAITRFFDQ